VSVYAVRKGRKVGIFLSWDEVKPLVEGYSRAEYKKFKSEVEAKKYLSECSISINLKLENSSSDVCIRDDVSIKRIIAYTNGSYEENEQICTYGIVLLDEQQTIVEKFADIVTSNEFTKSRNILGEVTAVIKSLEYASINGYQHISIYYGYEGLEKWYKGEWKTKRDISQFYVTNIRKYSHIQIQFQKIESHTDNQFSEMAECLAVDTYCNYINETRKEIIDHDNKELQNFNLFKSNYDNSNVLKNVIFVTGKAGTGKSTLIQQLKLKLKNLVILAPTGIAALNIGGETIHSFFNFPIEYFDSSQIDRKWIFSHSLQKLFYLTILVIDEVSMVRADIMDKIDKTLRFARRNNEPFGGVKVILVGDLFQLPPVLKNNINEEEDDVLFYTQKNNEKENYDDEICEDEIIFDNRGKYNEVIELNNTTKKLNQIILEKYGGIFFFNAPVFQVHDLIIVELLKVYRQMDAKFIFVLGKIRDGSIEVNDLDIFTKRIVPTQIDDSILTIAPTKRIVAQTNEQELEKIQATEFEYVATETLLEGTKFPTDLPAEKIVRLKPGAQVIILVNSKIHGYVNGTIGLISKIVKNGIAYYANGDIDDSRENHLENGVYVKINGNEKEQIIEQNTWLFYKYIYNTDTQAITPIPIAKYTQIPLRLAWAITIHKSQGLTFDKVRINFYASPFAEGQTYVALSRCRYLDGIYLSREIRMSDIKVSDEVIAFIKKAIDRGCYFEKE
jgi:ATP-dependent DNA helicase PIF1